MKLITPVLAMIVLTSTSCNHFYGKRVQGDGNIVSQTKQVSNFRGVDVGGNIDIVVTQDSAYSVRVETDNNLQELIEVYNSGDMLHIHPKDNFNLRPSRSTVVYVSAPVFESLYASGACNIKSTNKISSGNAVTLDLSGASGISIDVNAPKVDLQLSGASSATMKGETKDLSIDGSGSSDVKAFELLSENTNIQVSGASHAEVYASVKLEADGHGASSIRYKGNASVNSSSSGASSVKKVN